MLLPLLVLVFCAVGRCHAVNIVSIVDQSSVINAFIKVHSILLFAEDPARLRFGFVVFESPAFNAAALADMWRSCFNSTAADLVIVPWVSPAALQDLRRERFETELIFSRFYLPALFASWDRLLYLDNDVVVNCDLRELFDYPLTPSLSAATAESRTSFSWRSAVIAPPPHTSSVPRRANQPAVPVPAAEAEAVAGFVYERYPHYKAYLQQHFNWSAPLVRDALAAAAPDVFLNGGVFVLNCLRWRALDMTSRAEDMLRVHLQEGSRLFSTAAGDQGLFFLLLQPKGMAVALPAKFNMRRLPGRSTALLDQGGAGVVHFAGVLHGDPLQLCRYPLLYPALWPSALPLFLSTALSFAKTCPAAAGRKVSGEDSVRSLCPAAAALLQQTMRKEKVKGGFAASSRSRLTWPPS